MNPFDPELHFRLGSALALAGWVMLALSPPSRRWTPMVWRLTGLVLPLVLGVAYGLLFAVHHGPGGYGSLQAVRQLFDQPGLLAAGWLHYLAFDLFVGTWIARRGAAVGMPHAALLPCLALTFLFGPAGLLAFAALCALTRRPLFET